MPLKNEFPVTPHLWQTRNVPYTSLAYRPANHRTRPKAWYRVARSV